MLQLTTLSSTPTQCLQRTFILRLWWKLCTTHKFCKHAHCFQHLWATCLKPCPIWPLSVKSNLFLIFKPLYFRSIRCERFWSWELFPLACELGGCKALRDDVEVSRYCTEDKFIFVLNACHVKWNEISWSGHIHYEENHISWSSYNIIFSMKIKTFYDILTF